MKKKYYKKLVLLIIFCLAINFYIAYNVNAAASADLRTQLENAGKPSWGAEPTGNTSLSGIIATGVKAVLSLLGIIFLVLIIYAGFNWMTAQGDEEKVTLAKNTLTRAIIGLIIIISAYSITYFVFSSLPASESGASQTASPVINTD